MPMVIYKPLQATPAEFVTFWSLLYEDPREKTYYEDNIGRELTPERILKLFEWKNGGNLSGLKEASVRRNFVSRSGELGQLRPDQNESDFLAFFPEGGAIWRIFWLHCWQPVRFPIYDQHVHRAMAFIETGNPENIPAKDPDKIKSYVSRYLPFYRTFDGIGKGSRSVDKALWAFGKFLKNANGRQAQTLVLGGM
jgi:hypothetical protein